MLVDGEDDVAADAEDDGRLLPHRTFARAPSSTVTPVAHASTARSALKRSLKLMNAHLRDANRDALDVIAFIMNVSGQHIYILILLNVYY